MLSLTLDFKYSVGQLIISMVILDELCVITGYHRKWAIEILAKGHKTGKKASRKI